MEQTIPQEEIRRIIIRDMMMKRNSIVPIIGEDTVVFEDKEAGKEIPFQEFIFNQFQRKYPCVAVDDATPNDAEYAIFILDNAVGGITFKEFIVAMRTFKSRHKPEIYVYSHMLNESNEVFSDFGRHQQFEEIIKIRKHLLS